MCILVGNPIEKKTLIFTFDGKMEYIILPMLILFLDMWQNTYGWMPSLWLPLSRRNRSKVNWVQNIIYFATDTASLCFINLIMTRVCRYYIKILDVHLGCHLGLPDFQCMTSIQVKGHSSTQNKKILYTVHIHLKYFISGMPRTYCIPDID